MALLASSICVCACHAAPDQPGREIALDLQAFRNVQVVSALSSGVSVSATYTTTPTANNLLVAIVQNANSTSAAPTPSGTGAGTWIFVTSAFNNNLGQSIWYKFATGSEAQITVNFGGFTNLGHALQLFEFAGVDPTAGPIMSATVTGSTNPTYTFASVTTSSPALVLVAGVSVGLQLLAPQFNSTWSNSFTPLVDTSGVLSGIVSAYAFVSGAGTYTTTATPVLTATTMLSQTIAFQRRPSIVTDLAVSSGVNKNTVMFLPPSAPVTHVMILAKTTDCTFSGNPTGSEALGVTAGGGTVIFNGVTTSDMIATSVTLGTAAYTASTHALVHTGLTSGTFYCYKAIARSGTLLDDADPARPTRSGTPNSGGTTDPRFVFNPGTLSLSAPSVLPGVGAFYADNSGKLMSVDKTGLRRFSPYTLPNAVQSRSPAGTLSTDTDATVFATTLSGDLFAIWASGSSLGTKRWSTEAIDGDSSTASIDEALGDAIYASPLISNSLSRLFVPTRNSSLAQNRLFALDATTGACKWVFNGTCGGTTTGLNLGQVSSLPILDPTNNRLMFTSVSLLFGSTLWALDARDTPTGSRVLWSRNIGDSDSSITFADINRSTILVGTNTGRVYQLDPINGSTCWSNTVDGCGGTATGLEQAFCTASDTRSIACAAGSAIQQGMVALTGNFSNSYLFRTANGNIRRISSAGVQIWKSTSIAGSSAAIAVSDVNSGVVYVGGSDGVVRELSLTTGALNNTRNVGGGAIVVGDPTYDSTDGVLYVNTSAGNLYAFNVPF